MQSVAVLFENRPGRGFVVHQEAERIARRAARALAAEIGADLPSEVDSSIGSLGGESLRLDPSIGIAAASLVVSVAGLAWTVYNDLRRSGETEPSRERVQQALEPRLMIYRVVESPNRDRIIEVVIEETVSKGR